MLFGRRKPGFSKEVELSPDQIENTFSDRNDPDMRRNDNPKAEKADMAAQADAVMAASGMPEAAARAAEAAKELQGDPYEAPKKEGMDLFDYLESLPDVEDPFAPMEEDEMGEPEKTPAQTLAEYIRTRSGAAQLTAKKDLEKEEENLDELLRQLREDETCKDIRSVMGRKDEYFYSDSNMANNYAMIMMLVIEKDVARTVAHMVRFNCVTYPSPTPLYYFMRSPYHMKKEELDAALKQIEADESCRDIQSTTAFNGVLYLYSLESMSAKYAKALADGAEAGEADF